jgi:N utilization substance protein B
MLYQAEVASLGADETVRVHWESSREPDPAVRDFAQRLVRAVISSLPEIDALISSVSHHWPLERMGSVDRNVLRLALGEMRSEPETPAAVVIDEAVELARAYGETESHAFVNGLLDAARRRLQGGEARRTPPESGRPTE